MSVLPSPEFFEWLDAALKDKGWSDYRLSKEAGLSNSFMPNLRKGAKVGYEACAKIADALKVPRPTVYVKAGLDRGPIGQVLAEGLDDIREQISAIEKKLKAWEDLEHGDGDKHLVERRDPSRSNPSIGRRATDKG